VFVSRIPAEVHEELARRSAIEQRSMNSILGEALVSYFRAVKVPKSKIRAAIARVVADHRDTLDEIGDD
jgi:hypothetical protein